MIRRPPRSTRTDTLFPYTTLFRSKGTQVDGVYSDDPKKDKTATRYDRLTYLDVLQRDLKVMDASAISLPRENNISILVFSLHEPGGFAKVLTGTGRCTVIEGRSAERRVGKGWVRTCRSRWSPLHYKKSTNSQTSNTH